MNHQHTRVSPSVLTRRAALGSAGAFAATLGLIQSVDPARAQHADLTDHPMARAWLAMANPPLPDDPQIVAPSLFGVDGTVLLLFPVTQRGPRGPVFNSACVGTWESLTGSAALTSRRSSRSLTPTARSWGPSPLMATRRPRRTANGSSRMAHA